MEIFNERKLPGHYRSILLIPVAESQSARQPDPPILCDLCDDWNGEHEPFRVFVNTYYVGVAGLSSILIASDEGLILLDGGLAQSAPLIDANIRKLGFRTGDIRLIVNSHAHFDHAGGIAALQRASGAVVVASVSGARALQQGEPVVDDPQYAMGSNRFPPVNNVCVVENGETLRVGVLAITAYFTPAVVEQLPCDILLSVHPSFSGRRQGFATARPAHSRRAETKVTGSRLNRMKQVEQYLRERNSPVELVTLPADGHGLTSLFGGRHVIRYDLTIVRHMP